MGNVEDLVQRVGAVAFSVRADAEGKRLVRLSWRGGRPGCVEARSAAAALSAALAQTEARR